MALRQFCQEGNLKWVSLLMWAGANPRSRGPALDDVDHIAGLGVAHDGDGRGMFFRQCRDSEEAEAISDG